MKKIFTFVSSAALAFTVLSQSAYALTPGSVVFANAAGKNQGQDNANFFWSDALNMLGIGTNAPTSPLTVIGNTLTSTLSVGVFGANYPMLFDALTNTLVFNEAGEAKNIRIESDNDENLFFVDAVNDRIGVGLSNPTYEFEVANDGQNVEIVADTYSTLPGSSTKTVFGGRAARGTRAAPLPVQNNDILAEFSGLGYGTTAFAPSTTAGMRVIAAETFSDTAWGTGLFFRTTGRGSVILQTRMVVDADGNVGIGDTTPETPLDVEKLSVSTDVATFSNISGTCSINPGVAGGISCTSDRNAKKNIEAIVAESSLAKIEALRPAYFNWKGEADGAAKTSGFIAQEVEEVIPEVVVTKDGKKELSTIGLVPFVVSAVQELARKVDALSEKISTDKVETDMLCIGDTCITEAELIELLAEKQK